MSASIAFLSHKHTKVKQLLSRCTLIHVSLFFNLHCIQRHLIGLIIHCLCSCSNHLDLPYNVYVHAAITWTYYTLSMFMQRSLGLTIQCLCSCSDHLDLLHIVYVHAAITWTYSTFSIFMQRSLGLISLCLCSCSDHL